MTFDIASLKEYIRKNYSKDHPLQIVQQERDRIDSTEEYLAKVELWLKLSRL